MRINERMKRALSILLCVMMLVQYVPTHAFAATTDNLCDHHTEHTAECGYAPAVEGSPCTHIHDEACGYAEPIGEVLCACTETDDTGALVHTEGCGYVAPVAGSPCTHVHDASCGYVEAVEAHECHYECAECAAAAASEEPSEESSEPAPVCDCGTDDPAIHATTCAVYVAPENPVCSCAEACGVETQNFWCDVCGFDYSKCTGTDTAVVYADEDYTYDEATNTYTVYTADGLFAVAELVNDSAYAANITLAADIVLNENLANKVTVAEDGTLSADASVRKWTPMGENSPGEYQGTFDGGNHTITGLYCAPTGYGNTGLISDLAKGATVKNVKIHDFCLEESSGGAVVGYNRGEVIGCSISGTGILGWTTGYQNFGGVVGHNEGTVKDCTSSVALTFRGRGYFGGIVGQNMTSQATIIGCSNSGTITAAGYSDMKVGCILGGDMGTVKDCYNTGSIRATVEDGFVYVGGIVGSTNGTVSGCHNTGNISGDATGDSSYAYVGGIAGLVQNTVSGCYNTGAVSGKAMAESAETYVGGIAGSTYGTVSGCYNTAAVSGDATFEGTCAYVGGIVGNADGTVTGCHNTGTISVTADASSFARVGGITAVLNGTASNCYNSGSLVGDGRENCYVGGIAVECYNGGASNCYNIGSIDSGGYSGGIVAAASGGTFADCYYLDTCVKTGSPEYSSADGITEKTSDQFASGEVAYALNGDQSTITFKQTLGTDAAPNFTGGTVYQVSVTCTENAVVYANSQDTLAHNYVNSTCTVCGIACDHSGSTHTAVTDKGDGTHGYDCTVCGTAVTGEHTGGTATCTTQAVCDDCGASYGAVDTTNHDSSVDFNDNGFCPNGCYEPATDYNADGVYEIYNAGQLFWFAQQVNEEGNKEIKGTLRADIDLENRPWTPIGAMGEENSFRGVFDGQNYIIWGLYVEGSENGVGFFGEVRTGTVKNFTIYGNVVVNTEVDYVGGVIGSICGVNGETDLARNGAIVQNITSNVNITVKAHGVGTIGGLVGHADHQSLIEQCVWNGTFNAGSYRVDSGAGGFIGKIQENTGEVTIRNCGAYGTIKTNYAGDISIGGFLGLSDTGAKTTIENCLFAGKFERGANLTDEAELAAFGTLRYVKAIKNCYYLGDDGLAAVHSDSDLKPGSDNVEITSVTEDDLRNNTIATQLGDLWEQREDYPRLKDTGGHSHSYTYTDNGDGTHDQVCTVCDYVEVDDEAHSGGTATCTEQAECQHCGASYGDLLDHNWENGECTYGCNTQHDPHTWESGTCTVCGLVCTHESFENGTCTLCGISFMEGYGPDSDDSEFGTVSGSLVTSSDTSVGTSWSDETGTGNLVFQWGAGDALDVTAVTSDETVAYEKATIQPHGDDGKNADAHWMQFLLAVSYEEGTPVIAARGFDEYFHGDFVTGGTGSVANVFTQTASGDPGFLSGDMLMYGEAEYTNGTASVEFKHIPAVFRFIITNTHGEALTLNSVTLRVVDADGTPVAAASKDCVITVEAGYGYPELVYGSESYPTYDAVTTNITGGTLEPGQSYLAYALALPIGKADTGAFNEAAFKDKTIQVTVTTSEGTFIAFELAADDFASANPGNNYNWVGGKSYTMRMGTRCAGGCTFDATGNCTVCGYDCDHDGAEYKDNGDGTHDKVCDECGYVEVDNEAHTPAENTTYTNNDNGTHSFTCTVCGDATEAHSFDENGTCVCGVNLFTVSGSTLTIDGTLGGKTEATEEDITVLVNKIQDCVDNGITTITVTGSEPAMIDMGSWINTAIGEAIYRVSGSNYYDENNPYNGKIDLILQDVTEIVDQEFYDATALNSINLPNVTTVGTGAFCSCFYLRRMTFGSVVTSINQELPAVFHMVGADVDGCDLVLNCGQMKAEYYKYRPDLENNVWFQSSSGDTTWKSITLTHADDATYTNNGDGTHSYTCTVCGTVTEDHTGGTATCTTQAKCEHCGASYGEVDTTNHDSTVAFDSNGFCPNGCYEPATDSNADGVYEIGNAGQLYWFAAQVNSGEKSINAVLMHDIDLTNHTWTPIGVTAMGEGVTDGYTGTFDGQGHVISNITFATPTSAMAAGIFGTVQSGGTVKNLGVENLTFDNNDYDHRAGGIAGQLLADSTISDCYVINSTVKASSRVVGGIVGMNKGTVKNCYTYNMTLAAYNNRFGGISGDYSGGKLENCYTDYSALASSQAGTATNCEAGVSAERFASGEVAYLLGDPWGQTIGTDTSPNFTGGTVYQVTNCKNETVYSNTNETIGHSYENGICTVCGGYEPATDSDSDGYYEITNAGQLYWFAQQVNSGSTAINGELTADIVVNENVLTVDGALNGDGSNFRVWTPIGNNSYRYIGEFRGNEHTVSGLYFNGSANYVGLFGYVGNDDTVQVGSDGTVLVGSGGTVQNVGVIDSYLDGGSYVGGVVGYNDISGTVQYVYNTGNIQGRSQYVGGVVGRNQYIVRYAYNTGTVFAQNYAGGVVGHNNYILEYAYNTGSASDWYNYYVGVTGYNRDSTKLKNCYYLADSETDSFDGTTAKTAGQFEIGEVAYLLGAPFGQNIDNGATVQTLPVFSDATVYAVQNCKNEVDYSNTNENIGHSYENGFCPNGCYEPAVLNGEVYEISNAGQLYWFAQQVNGGNNTINAVLTADIDLENRPWTPIGTQNESVSPNVKVPYTGVFDGQGHVIKNLSIHVIDGREAGLFGRAQDATLLNLGVVDAAVVSDPVNGTGYRAGIVAGELHRCTVANVYSAGNLTVTTTHAQAGGIAGECADSTLTNCFTTYGCLTASNAALPTAVTNCYYLASSANADSAGTFKTGEQFESGEVAYLLGDAYGQTIGTDVTPNFNGAAVYYGYLSCADDAQPVYSNNGQASEEKPDHAGALTYENNTADGTHIGTYTCCGSTFTEEHTEGTAATCVSNPICSVCKYEYGEPSNSAHVFADDNETCKYCQQIIVAKVNWDGVVSYYTDIQYVPRNPDIKITVRLTLLANHTVTGGNTGHKRLQYVLLERESDDITITVPNGVFLAVNQYVDWIDCEGVSYEENPRWGNERTYGEFSATRGAHGAYLRKDLTTESISRSGAFITVEKNATLTLTGASSMSTDLYVNGKLVLAENATLRNTGTTYLNNDIYQSVDDIPAGLTGGSVRIKGITYTYVSGGSTDEKDHAPYWSCNSHVCQDSKADCITRDHCDHCGDEFGELGGHTIDITTGSCVICNEYIAVATVTDGTTTLHADTGENLSTAIKQLMDGGSRTLTVDLPGYDMITDVCSAVSDASAGEVRTVHLTVKGLTTIGESTGFASMTQLATLSLPDVTYLYEYALRYTELERLELTAEEEITVEREVIDSSVIGNVDLVLCCNKTDEVSDGVYWKGFTFKSVTFTEHDYVDGVCTVCGVSCDHSGGEVVYTWTEDPTITLTVTVSCTACGETFTGSTTDIHVTPSDDGFTTTYTATVTLDGMEYTDSKVVSNQVTSVNITWGEMNFTYTDESGWNNPDTAWVQVENTGNTAVSVTYDYVTERTDITGSFFDGTATVTAPVAINAAGTKKIWLRLDGTPSEALNNTTIGSVKLTIE